MSSRRRLAIARIVAVELEERGGEGEEVPRADGLWGAREEGEGEGLQGVIVGG